jgi:predicted TIM-barrel fold metal-dependent hydrolase
MPPIVVDCHSHVFNAEDIPIDGFLKRKLRAPSLLTGVFSGPLDLVAAGRAPGAEEAARLLVLIARRLDGIPDDGGLEGVGGDSLPEVLSDAELDARLVQYLSVERPAPPDGPPEEGGLESIGDPEDAIAALLAEASPEQLAEIDEWLGGAPEPEEGLEGIFDEIRERAAALRDMARRFRDALQLITQPRHRVVARLAATYPEVRLFVPTLVDFDLTARDRPSTPVHEQVSLHSLVAKLSVVGGIPGRDDVRVHPFVAFCPYREVKSSELARWDASQGQANPYVPYADPLASDPRDVFSPALRFDPARARPLRAPTGPWASATLDLAGITRSLDLVRHAVELGGFTGVKLYPPSGFVPIGNVFRFGERVGAPLDAALRALYRYCEDTGVPILTHASHSNGFDKGYDDLAAPSGWEQVLREYGGLHLCFGHFGHLYGAAAGEQTPGPNSWPMRYLGLIDRHDHVYADVGCSRYAFDTKYRPRFDRFLRAVLGPADSADPVHEKRRRRLMFGSDYWMNTLDGDYTRALSEFSAGIERQFGAEALAHFRGGNALRWLGLTRERPRQDDEIDTASMSYRRLVAFYGDQALPEWLKPR